MRAGPREKLHFNPQAKCQGMGPAQCEFRTRTLQPETCKWSCMGRAGHHCRTSCGLLDLHALGFHRTLCVALPSFVVVACVRARTWPFVCPPEIGAWRIGLYSEYVLRIKIKQQTWKSACISAAFLDLAAARAVMRFEPTLKPL